MGKDLVQNQMTTGDAGHNLQKKSPMVYSTFCKSVDFDGDSPMDKMRFAKKKKNNCGFALKRFQRYQYLFFFILAFSAFCKRALQILSANWPFAMQHNRERKTGRHTASARAWMTLPNVVNDLLMLAPS